MGGFVKGDVVKILFRFSDLRNAKPRPGFVLADLNGEDVILCQITKKRPRLDTGIELTNDSFQEAPLSVIPSYIRPVRLFATSNKQIDCKITSVTKETLQSVYSILNTMFST